MDDPKMSDQDHSMAAGAFENRKVLVVGAGGIGCELLKDLVLTGFHDIHVVDLDTIELSNLNRQFLFRRRHIGKFKSEVAAEAVMAMNGKAKVVAHVGNIMDTDRFPFSFFKQFEIVLNALDNIGARRYVNGVCQGLGLPLVESGTAGYHGQCTVILPRRSECYDCTAKEPPKTFAVCTIRSTPSAPIHCVVWAKDYLLQCLFGEEQPQADDAGEIVDGEHMESLRRETEAFKRLRELAKSSDESFGSGVFRKIFHDDLEAIRAISTLWEDRAPPSVLDLDALEVPESLTGLNDQEVWTVPQWTALLLDSLRRLRDRSFANKKSSVQISFDKDDSDTLDFVAAVANLRAHVYGIPMTSKFALKAIAGNIIPAIATTNAIAAGMIVVQARNILQGLYGLLADCFITFDATRKNYFLRSQLCEPNPSCATCFVHRCRLLCDPKSFTVGDVVEKVVPLFSKQLKTEVECLSLLEGSRMLWDADDMPQTAHKTLHELSAGDSKFIRCEMADGLALVIAVLTDQEASEGEFTCVFDLIPQDKVQLGTKRALEDDDDDDFEVVAEADSDLEILN